MNKNKISSLLKDIEEFAAFEKNWDSYDADPINPKAIELTKSLLTILEAKQLPEAQILVSVLPICDGSLCLEFHRWREKLSLEIFVYADHEELTLYDLTEQPTPPESTNIEPRCKILFENKDCTLYVVIRKIEEFYYAKYEN